MFNNQMKKSLDSQIDGLSSSMTICNEHEMLSKLYIFPDEYNDGA
jgi:hypothetical protein